jgi:hypothetical protein
MMVAKKKAARKAVAKPAKKAVEKKVVAKAQTGERINVYDPTYSKRIETDTHVTFERKNGEKPIVFNKRAMTKRTKLRWEAPGAHERQADKMRKIHRDKLRAEATLQREKEAKREARKAERQVEETPAAA